MTAAPRSRVRTPGKTVLVFLAAVLTLAFGCSRREEPAPPVEPPFAPAEVADAYVALVENPAATNVLLVGERATRLAPCFERAGVRPGGASDGRFDIVVVSGAAESAADCGREAARLAEGGVLVWLADVRRMTAEEFRAALQASAFADFHLWMPEETRWAIVGRQAPRKVALAAMLELFAREEAFEDLARGRCETLPELFASYVGARADVVPAFAFLDARSGVRSENFVMRDIPRLDWISDEGVDADIVRSVRSGMRSMQNIRRIVFEGNRLAAEAKDRKGEEAATDAWARAVLHNPNDPLLLARLDRLERNARTFLAAGKVPQAMKCYETMVLVRPNDPVAVHNFGMCLKKIGRTDLAEKVLARARTLEEAVK